MASAAGRSKTASTSSGQRSQKKLQVNSTVLEEFSPVGWYRLPPTDRIGVLRVGVPSDWLIRTEALMHLPRQTLCRMLGLPTSTIKRRLNDNARLNPDESERLMGLHQLIGQVEAMVEEAGDPEGFKAAPWLAAWLERPNLALGGQRPADLMDTAEGRSLVSRLLGMIRSGAYA